MIICFSVDPGADTGWRLSAWCEECPAVAAHLFYDVGGEMSMGWTDKEETAAVLELMELFSLKESDALNFYIDEHMKHLEEGIAEIPWLEARRCLTCEGFTLRERTSDRSLLSPVRLKAKLEMGIEWDPNALAISDYTSYSASDAKKVFTDERLKARGMYVPGKPHMNDASRHMLLIERKLLKLERKVL